jgi:predicted ribosomally synthesized peptide with SipW-like signal peptide
MKKIIGLTITAIIVIALAGVATYAYFQDTESTGANTFTAGTLNLQLGATDPSTAILTVTNANPNQSGAADWDLKNTGNLPGYLNITFTDIVDSENLVNEPEDADTGEDGTFDDPGTDGELAENLDVLIYIDGNSNDSYNSTDDTLIYQGKLKTVALSSLNNFAMTNGYSQSIRVEWSVASGVGNLIQSDSAGFTMNCVLNQVENQ